VDAARVVCSPFIPFIRASLIFSSDFIVYVTYIFVVVILVAAAAAVAVPVVVVVVVVVAAATVVLVSLVVHQCLYTVFYK
jgi:fatty acid desaturase